MATRTGRRGALALLGLAGISVVAPARATAQSGCSDHDAHDPAGNGRRCGESGCSDADHADAGGSGRHCPPMHDLYRCSDTDPTDPAGGGRHC